MSLELVYRMRTCAAALTESSGNANTPFQRAHRDAAELLIEASNLIEAPEPLGEPMKKIEPTPVRAQGPTWTTMDLPTVAPQPCPCCGGIDARRADIKDRRVRLTCPRCTHQWEYGRGQV